MPIRVATANLLHGLSLRTGEAREADLRAAASILADVDLVGLQEVDRAQPRSEGVDQTAVFAQALGTEHFRFVPTISGTPGSSAWDAVSDGEEPAGPAYGIGLVSRWPVLEWHVRRFRPAPVGTPLLVPARPRPRLIRVPDEPRAAILARVDAPGGPLTVVTTHLSFVPGFNVRQLRALVRWAAGFPPPRLLAGDVNLPGPVPARVSGWRRLARTATYPSYRPRVQFDHVLGDGAGEASGARGLQLPVSDHCALVVELAT